LVAGGDDGTATGSQVVNQTALRHVLSDNVIHFAENNTNKSDKVRVPQRPVNKQGKHITNNYIINADDVARNNHSTIISNSFSCTINIAASIATDVIITGVFHKIYNKMVSSFC